MPRRARIGLETWSGHVGVPDQVRPEQWVEVNADALPEKQRDLFLRRKRGIELYYRGASSTEIREGSGFGRSHIYRLITERCFAQHQDGNLYGWRGALPHLHIKTWTRTKPLDPNFDGSGAAGALQWLFESPGGAEHKARFTKRILEKAPTLENSKRSYQSLFLWFIKELRKAGYEARNEWPFTVERMGYVTILRFIDKVIKDNPRRALRLQGGETGVRKARAGDGTNRPRMRLFQRVECDAHKLDTRMVVLVPSPHGGYEPRKIHRLWVIVILEVVTRAVIGYHLSFHREVNAEDVLRAIKNALTPWRPREIRFSNQAYSPGACLPSGRHERYVGACWDEFSVDGALANVCERVKTQLREIVGAVSISPQEPGSYSVRRSLDDRPFIESFFRQLSTGGLHRLSTTTGSSPKDKRSGNPDVAAAATQFQLEWAEEVLDVLMANYNVTPHSGLGYRSPLTQMDFLSDREPGCIRQADPGDVRRMVGHRKLCPLLGGESTGMRPHFNFEGARYSAEWVCLRTDLLGKYFWLHVEDEDDCRFATVANTKGEILGVVRAAPPWHRTPHTLFIRTAIRSLVKRKMLHLTTNCDAIELMVEFCEGSRGKKLPVHPAYLELRHLLEQYAEERKWSSKGRAHSNEQLDPDKPKPAIRQPTQEGDSAHRDEQPSMLRKLPVMHKAKIW